MAERKRAKEISRKPVKLLTRNMGVMEPITIEAIYEDYFDRKFGCIDPVTGRHIRFDADGNEIEEEVGTKAGDEKL